MASGLLASSIAGDGFSSVLIERDVCNFDVDVDAFVDVAVDLGVEVVCCPVLKFKYFKV